MMNICTAANSKYVRYLYVMLTSLLVNNADEDICLYMLQRNLTEADKVCVAELMERYGKTVEFLQIDERDFASLPTDKYPLETNFRLALPDILPPSVDRALYLDADTIVQGNLREFYATDLQGKSFGVCQDISIPELDEPRKRQFRRNGGDLRYFNAGVMLWDLEKARKKYSFKMFMDAAAALEGNLPCPDQDILNYLACDDVTYLDARKYNYMFARYIFNAEKRYARDALVLHYAGGSPWLLGPRDALLKIWWRYAERTPFYARFLAEQPSHEEAALAFVRKLHIMTVTVHCTAFCEEHRASCRADLDACLPDGKARLWGNGQIGRNCAQALRELDIEVETIFDQNAVEADAPGVVAPTEENLRASDTPIIVSTTQYELEIAERLSALGYRKEKDYFLWSEIVERWIVPVKTETEQEA